MHFCKNTPFYLHNNIGIVVIETLYGYCLEMLHQWDHHVVLLRNIYRNTGDYSNSVIGLYKFAFLYTIRHKSYYIMDNMV